MDNVAAGAVPDDPILGDLQHEVLVIARVSLLTFVCKAGTAKLSIEVSVALREVFSNMKTYLLAHNSAAQEPLPATPSLIQRCSSEVSRPKKKSIAAMVTAAVAAKLANDCRAE
jgi:hypothetical protein